MSYGHFHQAMCIIFDHAAGLQQNSSLAFCSQSETIIIVVTLPMTKTIFIASEQKYISSIAMTARVIPENVKILSIDEVSMRSFRNISRRLLLGSSVKVQTSILIAIGQQTYIKDQSVLNSDLNKNGLPSATLVQYTHTSVGDVTTPAPEPKVSGSSEAENVSGSTNVLIGAIVGGTGGLMVLLAVTFLALRLRTNRRASPLCRISLA